MSRDITLLHPEMRILADEFVRRCKAAGLNVLITETYRTAAEQDALYAKGRTAPGSIVTNARGSSYSSAHQWGVAFDICRNVKGKEYDDKDCFFAKCGAIGQKLGLEWGGSWKGFVDKPHYELKKYMPNNSTATLKKQYGTPEAFKKKWSAYATPKKEDTEMIDTVNIKIDGKIYTFKRILKDGFNFVDLQSFKQAGISVEYDNINKMPVMYLPK